MFRVIKNKIITTADNIRYWKNRKIAWKQAYFKPEHEHRKYIVEALRPVARQALNLIEIGCGAGANLFKIHQHYPHILLGGIDVNKEAIDTAKELLPKNSLLRIAEAEDLYFSSKSIDVILTDACLMYLGPKAVKRALREIKRAGRGSIILCEPMSKNLIIRFLAWRRSGYFLHDYKKLLEKLDFFDIQEFKLPKGSWEDTGWEKYGYILKAHV